MNGLCFDILVELLANGSTVSCRHLVELRNLFLHYTLFWCSSWTNKLITAKDHRSIQVNVGHLDESGLYTGSFSAFALTGQVRAKGDADSALDILWSKKRAEIGQ